MSIKRQLQGRRSSRPRWHIEETSSLLIEVQRCATSEEICNQLLHHLEKFGVSNLLAGAIPPAQSSCREQRSRVLLDAWPDEWSHRYFGNGYLYRDPAIRLVCRGFQAFRWDDVERLCRICPLGRRIMQEAEEFGLGCGLTFGFSSLERQAIGFSLAGDRLELGPGEELSLQLVTAFAFGCAATLAGQARDRQEVRLSPRQKDVIQWAAEGLTVDQTAERLGISNHTADTHWRTVRQKLGAANGMQAIAEAFRRGLID